MERMVDEEYRKNRDEMNVKMKELDKKENEFYMEKKREMDDLEKQREDDVKNFDNKMYNTSTAEICSKPNTLSKNETEKHRKDKELIAKRKLELTSLVSIRDEKRYLYIITLNECADILLLPPLVKSYKNLRMPLTDIEFSRTF